MEHVEKVGSKSPRAIEILKRIPGGDKIVGMPTETPAPSPVIKSKAPVEETYDYDIDPPKEEVKTDSVQKDPIPKEFVPDDPTDEIDQIIDPKGTTGENFKKLRTKLKSVNQERRQFAEELEVLRKKVGDYENGLAVPEVTQKQIDRIAELEKYEQVYNFESSPIYQEKFAGPIREDQAKLLELAKEYEVDTNILNQAFAADTSVEQNRILNQAFPDEIGALEAKSLMKNIKKIQGEALSVKEEGKTAFVRLQEDNDRIIREKRAKANDAIVNVSKDAWSESLTTLREDSRFPEITYREGDSEHNEKFVRPILTKAGQEYGRIIKTLAQHGTTELPKDLAIAFARMAQLSHLSAVTAVQRDTLAARVKELEGLMKNSNRINRPGLNGSSGVTPSPSTGAVGAANAGKNVLARVSGK